MKKRSMSAVVSCAIAGGLCFTAWLLAGDPTPGEAGVQVVVNPKNRVESLSPEKLSDIFLGRMTTWSDGSRIRPAVMKEGGAHNALLAKWIHKTPMHFKVYWRKRVFAGDGMAPPVFETEAEMLTYVASTEGAIGYAGQTTNSTVKIIAIREEKKQ